MFCIWNRREDTSLVTRSAVGALALVYVLAHLPFLAVSLDDIDSVNFALGVRDFDVARHRPHPPGYPLYIGFAKASVAIADLGEEATARSRAEARAMSVLSLVGAAMAMLGMYGLFACLSRGGADRVSSPWRGVLDARALAATTLAVACPLFWYLAIRPMSDVPGLAAAVGTQTALALAWWRQRPVPGRDRRLAPDEMAASGRMIVLGCLLAAVAIGFRSQNAMLTVPFALAVLLDRVGLGVAGALVGGGIAFAVGALIWAIPLLAASGGLSAYLAVLGTQAGEDFAGVDMLYLNPSPRLAADAVLRTFIYPWDSLVLGGIVTGLAALGIAALLLRDRRSLAALIALGAPYLAFHLLFHDMNFVRYALPLVPPVAFLVVCGIDLAAPRAVLPLSGVLVLWSVAVASPVLAAYAAEPSPTARVLRAMRAEAGTAGPVTLAMHQTFQRPLEAETVPIGHQLPSPPRREWLELARYWRDGNVAPVWFLADPRRTDLALIDPQSRRDRRDFAWRFSSLSDMGGMRPAAVAWYRLPPPGWFAEEGWALTPEVAGTSRAMGRGPHLAPITAWAKRRASAARLLVGGRHLGAEADSPAEFRASLDGKPLAAWSAGPGFFLEIFDLPAGTLSGPERLGRLEIRSAGESGSSPPTAIEQFDLQPVGTLMWGFDQGWHEPEYTPRLGQWRWTSDRATLRIVDADAPLRLRLQIESPLRYFDAPPTVRLTAAGHVLSEIRPRDSGVLEVTVPLEALELSRGRVTIETDRTFVPAERGGPPDRRRLGLRVFRVEIVDRTLTHANSAF